MEFHLGEICNQCQMTEEEAFETLEKLTSMKLEEKSIIDKHTTVYYFLISNAAFVFPLFKIAELLVSEHCWHVVRDTSLINDYAFEKLWDKKQKA